MNRYYTHMQFKIKLNADYFSLVNILHINKVVIFNQK